MLCQQCVAAERDKAAFGVFGRDATVDRKTAAKTRRERIVEEMVAQLDSTLNSVPNWWPTAESWADRYEAAVKKVDGE